MGTKQSTPQTYVSMPVLNPQAAGIDIGSRFHMVAIGQNIATDVKEFGVYTQDLFALADYLKSNGIKTVAMEATGGYQNPLVVVLQEYDFEVVVTSGVNTKNLKGKKTDVHDAMHIQQMHSLGLLPPCFIPNNFSMELRGLVRLRRSLIDNSADYLRRMLKVLRNANMRLDVAFSSSKTTSALKIIEAILAGETQGENLAKLAHKNCKKSKEEIAKALTGNIKQTDLFQLNQCYRIYQNFMTELSELDKEIEKIIQTEAQATNPDLICPKTKKKVDKNVPKFAIEQLAYQVFEGINLDLIPSFGRDAILVFMAEVGEKIYEFKSAKAFANYLKLTPNHKITGGKIKSKSTMKNKSLLTVRFKMVATTIGNIKDNNPLTAFFRRIQQRAGTAKAITATANKLARIVWTLFNKKENFDANKLMGNQKNMRENQIKKINKKIENLNLSKEEMAIFVQNINASLAAA